MLVHMSSLLAVILYLWKDILRMSISVISLDQNQKRLQNFLYHYNCNSSSNNLWILYSKQ